MANAPPTPPATTPVELQDAARVAASPSAAESSAPAPVQTDVQMWPEVYQRAVHVIDDAISKQDYQSLIRFAEETDFIIAKDRQPARMLVAAPLVLGHLIDDNIPPARYALQRLPDSLSSLPLSRALSSLIIYTMNRQHAQLYDQADSLINLVSQPDFFDKDLGLAIQALTFAFLESFRKRTFELLSKAYTSLPSSLACIYLGWPIEQIINVAERFGWSYDHSTQILCPKHDFKSTSFGASTTSNFSSLNTFDFVANSVAQLES